LGTTIGDLPGENSSVRKEKVNADNYTGIEWASIVIWVPYTAVFGNKRGCIVNKLLFYSNKSLLLLVSSCSSE
jgi:hypothetical protein